MSTIPNSADLQPAWEVATLFPAQGAWSVADYLALTDDTNQLVEYIDGCIEVLEMPTTSHQLILAYLFSALRDFVLPRQLGVVLFAALRMKISETKFREPDILFCHKDHGKHIQDRYWTSADLVMEIVSEDDASRERDLVLKRAEYSAAKIPEYWIVDPLENLVTVLVLQGDDYVALGEFIPGQQAKSMVLDGFSVDVAKTFDAAKI